jgi:hypothetical protein
MERGEPTYRKTYRDCDARWHHEGGSLRCPPFLSDVDYSFPSASLMLTCPRTWCLKPGRQAGGRLLHKSQGTPSIMFGHTLKRPDIGGSATGLGSDCCEMSHGIRGLL